MAHTAEICSIELTDKTSGVCACIGTYICDNILSFWGKGALSHA